MKELENEILKASADRPVNLRQVLVPLAIICVAILVAIVLMKTKRKAKQKPRGERASVVSVVGMKRSNERVVINVSGTVVPGREIILQARVAGEVVRIDPRFIPGGRFKAGEIILEIDPADYEIAVTKSRATLVKAEYDLQIEMGMQDIARYEWAAIQKMDEKKMHSNQDRELALRKPHLRLAEGNLEAARAQLAQVKLNLARCRVRAPFNAVIRSRNVDVGSQVATQSMLAELAGTDACWVRASLPVGQMRWIESAAGPREKGSDVVVSPTPGMDMRAWWHGHVLRKLVDLERAGKQSQILVEIPEPDNPERGKGQLLFGAYVRVAISGAELTDIFAIPRRALRGGKKVWIMAPDGRLDIRDVKVAWADKDLALIRKGVKPGEKLIVTDIGIPINGMLLQAEGSGKSRGSNKRGKGGAGR
ncbi:MAG: efflux RND transporter periplasmic adaptor subunit [Kiritimatiellae bacterium]|nr:efflux RND transporter periplasmic adaptor subunit [Kiritimatiellia bacterium]